METGGLLVKPRDSLKSILMNDRLDFSPGTLLTLICPLCRKPIHNQVPEMHEALITKGMTRGLSNQDKINSRYNCVLVHPKCHRKIQGSGGVENQRKCAEHLVKFEGCDQVEAWLGMMADQEFKIVGSQALRTFEGFQLGEIT